MLTRRAFTRRVAAVLALSPSLATLAAACSPAPPQGAATSAPATTANNSSSIDFHMAWWGGDDRANRTQQVLQLFQQQHPRWTYQTEFTSFPNYWTKLSTEVAAGAVPDILQMDMAYIAQYTSQNLLLDLSRYRDKGLRLADFSDTVLEQGIVAGKLTGIPMGGNMPAQLYNQTAIQAAGMDVLPDQATWDDWLTYSEQLAQKLPAGKYPADDDSGGNQAFEVFIRQRGKEKWTPDGKLAFTRQDVVDWFQFWANMRRVGGIVPGTIAAAEIQSGAPSTETIVQGYAQYRMDWSNNNAQFQPLTKDSLSMKLLPNGPPSSKPGTWVKAALLFSVSASTAHPDECVALIDYMCNDPAAVKILGVERGVPPSTAARQLLEPQLSPLDQAQVKFFQDQIQNTTPKKVLDPASAGEVAASFTRNAQSIALNNVTPADAADKFMTEATRAVGG